ncbi:hypothetical protein R6Q57_007754 [Mikania cordata]
MKIGHQKVVDWDVLTEIGEHDGATQIIGEDTSWREIPVEFLSTFTYWTPQEGDQDWDPELEISFHLFGQRFFSLGTKASVTRIRDPPIRYIHRFIAMSITGRGKSRECGRTCHLGRCLAQYFMSYYHRRQRRAVYGDAYITIISRTLGLLHDDSQEVLSPLGFQPVRLDIRTLFGMCIMRQFPEVGLRFSLQGGHIWMPEPVVMIDGHEGEEQGGGPEAGDLEGGEGAEHHAECPPPLQQGS